MQDDVVPTRKKGKEESEVKDSPVRQGVRGKMRENKAILLIATALAIIGFTGTIVFYQKYQDVKSNPAQAQKAQNSAETQRVLAELKKILRVDETEAPTVARVEDTAKLKKANAEFYKNVEKGDYLIIFPKRAIIYRESVNQLINIAPIISTSGTNTEQKPAATDTKTTTNTTITNRTTTR